MRRVLRFGVLIAVLIALSSLLLGTMFQRPGDDRAIRISAVLAFVVQLFAFAVLLLVDRAKVFPAWGLGTLLRLAALAVMGFWLVHGLALRAEPALISLATFFFLTALVEPLLLRQ